jgi:galactosamine-6-phosphate isomerase
MQVRTYPDYQALSRAAAELMADYLRRKPASLVCLASGHTPLGTLACLVQMVQSNTLSIDQCRFIGLDEWVGMNGKDAGSCRHMMDEAFFRPLQIPESQIHFFNGRAQHLAAEVDRIDEVIDANGCLDIMLVGIGTNGHIAMNEPGSSFDQKAHISQLAEETIAVGQKYFQQPTALDKGITLGLQNFRDARLPILMANDVKKAAIIKRVLSEKPNEQCPATIVHQIDRSVVMLDAAAASLL